MNLLKYFLRLGNRNYVTTKQYNRLIISRHVPVLLALIVGWVAIPELRWLWLAIGLFDVALGLLSYFFLDKWFENWMTKFLGQPTKNKEEK